MTASRACGTAGRTAVGRTGTTWQKAAAGQTSEMQDRDAVATTLTLSAGKAGASGTGVWLTRGTRSRSPALIATAAVLALAACAPGGGITNPMAGMSNPLTSLRLPVIGGTAGAAGAGPATPGGTAGIVDPFAGQGVKPPDIPTAGEVKATPSVPAASTGTRAGGVPAGQSGSNTAAASAAARTHRVETGETAWSIARKYGVPIATLAQANSLPETMTVRTGQTLTIPAGGTGAATGTGALTSPGAGSPTPEPPSASKPLPREKTGTAGAPVAKPSGPDLGATRTAASGGGGRFAMPVAGSITRTYSKGKNEGIDISAPAGTAVKAAGSGTVAAVTRDTNGTPIVVVRHEGSLMTVYAGLGELKVAKGDAVKTGQSIGTSGKSGTLHFEVRQGFDSVDPEGYLR